MADDAAGVSLPSVINRRPLCARQDNDSMIVIEFIVFLFFAIAIVYLLSRFFRDPLLSFKSFLRALKPSHYKLIVLLFPIWFPIWIIDKIFNLKIYISEIEESSVPKEITFSNYEKYIIIGTENSDAIVKCLFAFKQDFHKIEYNYDISKAEIFITTNKKNAIIRIDQYLEMKTFKVLMRYFYNSSTNNKVWPVKGVLIDNKEIENSFYISITPEVSDKLVGLTYKNKKIYAKLLDESNDNDKIYYNSDIDYQKKFDFDNFFNEMMNCDFKKIQKPSTQQVV